MFSFKPGFSLSSFTLIKRLFNPSLLSAIKVISSSYLRLLIFLLAIFIPACDSSSPAFHIMYSVYKRNKQGDNIQPWYTPFPILNQSAVPRPVQTVASWLAYGFLRRQVKWSYSHLFKNFPQFVAIYTDLGVHRPEAALPLGIWAWTRGLHSPVMQALCVWAGDFGISGIWAWPRRWG